MLIPYRSAFPGESEFWPPRTDAEAALAEFRLDKAAMAGTAEIGNWPETIGAKATGCCIPQEPKSEFRTATCARGGACPRPRTLLNRTSGILCRKRTRRP